MNEIHKPVLIVIAGPNGSGKTTITSKILHHEWLEQAVYINPDFIAQEKFGDWNSDDSVLKAAQFCEKWREECLENHRSLIFETVLSSEGKIEFIKKAKEFGYFIRLFFVCTESPQINAARIAKRVMEGGHDVPIKKIVSRYQKAILNSILAAKISDRAYFYDNSIENQEALLLFRTTDGSLTKQYKAKIPQWSNKILELLR